MPRRKTPIHLPLIEIDNRSPIVFLTVCTARRRPLLARPAIHDLLTAGWKTADHWAVGRYMIMPDHIHLFCAPRIIGAPPVKTWVTFWKAHVSRRWPDAAEHPIWQADCWDRQLRTVESYAAKWEYVRHNPVRADLVGSPEAWPYQGELNALEWHAP